MTSGIVNIVIDERKQLDNVDNAALMSLAHRHVTGHASRQRVFKDYILSSEVFYLDGSPD